MNKLLSSKQAAEYLGISDYTLRLWRSNMNNYPLSSPTPMIKCRYMGRKVLYEMTVLDEFISKNTRGK